jgi:hypothetical protein
MTIMPSIVSQLWERERALEWEWGSVSAIQYPLDHVDDISQVMEEVAMDAKRKEISYLRRKSSIRSVRTKITETKLTQSFAGMCKQPQNVRVVAKNSPRTGVVSTIIANKRKERGLPPSSSNGSQESPKRRKSLTEDEVPGSSTALLCHDSSSWVADHCDGESPETRGTVPHCITSHYQWRIGPHFDASSHATGNYRLYTSIPPLLPRMHCSCLRRNGNASHTACFCADSPLL